jgi:peptide-methionine (S)-S-oxide reductase
MPTTRRFPHWLPGLLLLVLAGLTGCTRPATQSSAVDSPVSPHPADQPPAAPSSPVAPPMTPPAPTPPQSSPANAPATKVVATFASGCFWCTEAVLERLDGVLDVTSGYMGGHVDNPTYRAVCEGDTGHAECVQVTFDPARIRYEDLLEWFFRSHDPTTLNRQGADEGTQYRSAIFWHDEAQREAAQQAIAKYKPQFASPIVTEVTAASRFWPAEQYHQDYFRLNPEQGYCRMVIKPKLQKLQKLGIDDKPK